MSEARQTKFYCAKSGSKCQIYLFQQRNHFMKKQDIVNLIGLCRRKMQQISSELTLTAP